jgi:hypothetical protein
MIEDKYVTPQQIAREDDFPFTMGQLRFFLANRKENGLHIAVRKIGRGIYIRKDLLYKWMDEHV